MTFVTAFGETRPSPATPDVATPTGSVILSEIPLSLETNTTGRKIYRTLSGGASWFAVALINDNTTTVYVDTAADGGLVVLAPTYNSAMSREIARGVLSLSEPLVSTLDMFVSATIGGGQVNGAPLTKEYNRLINVASDGDSVVLPHVNTDLGGMKVVIKNSGTGIADVFPFLGQSINDLATNVAVPLAPATVMTFLATPNETWETF